MSITRITSRTPLNPPLLPTVNPKSQQLHFPHLIAALHTRKPKQRTTFFAVVVLVFFSTYLFILHNPQLAISAAFFRPDSPASDHLALALESIQNSRQAVATKKILVRPEQIVLDPAQELAAISSFIASLPQNVIPLTVDPSRPIDPELVLDFDTRGPRAAEEVDEMVDDVWLRNPVFLYSKLYSPVSREVKALLAELNLRPAPTIIDVDVRDDTDVLKPLIARLTSPYDFPVLLIGGKPVGSVAELKEMAKAGELQTLITQAGAVVNGAKTKKHK